MINSIWILLQILTGYNLVLPLILFFLYKISKTSYKEAPGQSDNIRDYAIIVTAFEQTDLIPSVVKSILELKYDRYLVYIVADKCDISNLNFNDERIILLRPEETLASNTRSHFYAINRFKRAHDVVTIIDSDNLVHPDYLTEINVFFDKGFVAVQGVREAKNLNTTYACLDAARDIYYHFFDGKLLFSLGSSATLAGSGMAFTTELYKECLEHNDIEGAGFDKVLQAEIVRRDLRISFSEDAIVYDEKTSASDQLVKQRSRWINTWFKYFGYGFSLLTRGVRNFSANQFLFGLILLRPPLFITLLLSVLFMLANLWTSFAAVLIWGAAFLCFVLTFAIALSQSKTDPRIYRSLINIPVFIFYQVISLLKMRSKKKTVATKHTYYSEIEEIQRP